MIDKEILNDLINVQQLAYEEIGRKYGVSGNAIKKQARKLNIELPKRRKINAKETFNKGTGKDKGTCINCRKSLNNRQVKFCSHKCQREYEQKEWEKRWKEGKETGITGKYGISDYLRTYLFKKYNNKCARCGWGEINSYTNRIPLEVEHIDGNYLNNSEENLILLCPNCHSLTATYKGANRGNGRKERKKYTK